MFETRDQRSGISTEFKPAGRLGLTSLVLLAVLSFAPQPAKAAEDWLVGGAADSGMTYDPWAPGVGLAAEVPQSGTIGYALQPLRTQGDGLSQSLTPGPGSTTGFMARGYYDLAITPRWRLFAGAGLGMARLPANQELDLGSLSSPRDPATRDQDETVFAYQGMLGMSYEFGSPFQMYLGYRFFVTDPLDSGSRTDSREQIESEASAAHSGLIGFRYNF